MHSPHSTGKYRAERGSYIDFYVSSVLLQDCIALSAGSTGVRQRLATGNSAGVPRIHVNQCDFSLGSVLSRAMRRRYQTVEVNSGGSSQEVILIFCVTASQASRYPRPRRGSVSAPRTVFRGRCAGVFLH